MICANATLKPFIRAYIGCFFFFFFFFFRLVILFYFINLGTFKFKAGRHTKKNKNVQAFDSGSDCDTDSAEEETQVLVNQPDVMDAPHSDEITEDEWFPWNYEYFPNLEYTQSVSNPNIVSDNSDQLLQTQLTPTSPTYQTLQQLDEEIIAPLSFDEPMSSEAGLCYVNDAHTDLFYDQDEPICAESQSGSVDQNNIDFEEVVDSFINFAGLYQDVPPFCLEEES